jgi:hypothetical protein
MKNKIAGSMNFEKYFDSLLTKMNTLFARGLVAYVSALVLIILAVSLAVFLFINSAVPNTIIITSGPEGCMFSKIADKYAKILAREGIKLKIVPSEGASDN